jgi:hypothetical protein
VITDQTLVWQVLFILKKGTNWTKRETKITLKSPNGAILIQPGATPQEIQVMPTLSIAGVQSLILFFAKRKTFADDLSLAILYCLNLDCQTLVWTPIDFQKNNFTLFDPSPEIPYLKWARVRQNWRLYT